MNKRLAPRLMSFALATLVTWTIYSGIDTLALAQHAGAAQMATAATATQLAATKTRAPRS